MTARKRNALSVLPTAKNSRTDRVFGRSHSIVAFLFRVIKGKPEAVLLVADSIPLALNLRTDRAFGLYF